MRITLVSAALLAANIASAATPIDGWYGSVFGGYAYLPNNVSNTYFGLTRNSATYDSGYDAGGSFGFKSTPLRYEAELTYLTANLDTFQINGLQQRSISGYTNAVLAMANIYYDFPDMITTIQPYLGVGLGYGLVKAKLVSNSPVFGYTQYDASNSVFAYQATGGVIYNFSECYALSLGYRYVGTTRVDDLGKALQAHLANVGITYRFDGIRYK